MKCSDIPYSPSDSLDDNEYSYGFEDDDLESNNVKSPVSYFNISSRAPLHSNHEFESTLEDDILPLEVEINERKRKFEDLQEQKSNKALKLWNIMKYPFQKITIGSSIIENKGNISKAEAVIEEEEEKPNTTVYENDANHFESKEINDSNNIETETEVEDTSDNNIKKNFKVCNIM